MKTIEDYIIQHITALYEQGQEDREYFEKEIETPEGVIMVTAKVHTTWKKGLKSNDYDTPDDPDTATYQVEIIDMFKEKHYLKNPNHGDILPIYIFFNAIEWTYVRTYKGVITHFQYKHEENFKEELNKALNSGYTYCTRQELSDFYAEQTKELNQITKEI